LENTENIKIEKKLKNKKFDLVSSALGCLIFIALQFVVEFMLILLSGAFSKSLIFSVIASIVVEGLFFVAALITASARKVEYFKASGFEKKFSWKTALIAVAVSVICLFGFNALTNVFVVSLQKLGYNSAIGGIAIPNFGFYILYVILMCVIPAICEEALFRGTILKGMLEKGKTYAVMMSALLFMLMHGGPDQTIHQFILGIILGYLLVYSGSIWVPILVHFLNNFYAITIIYITGDGSSQVQALPSWGELALTLVIGLAMAAISAYLIFLCIKAVAKFKKEQDEKDKSKMQTLLDKENLTEKEIKWLKRYQENLEVKALEETEGETATEDQKSKKKVNVPYVVMLTVSIVLLSASWLVTLITGF